MTTLEDELRAKLREPVPVPRPGMAEHVVTRVRRQQVRRRAALLVAVTLVFGASAFALSTPGGQRAIVTATPASGCDALTTGVVGAGGSGVRTRQFVMVLTNTDAESVCRVDPDVELSLIAEGRRLDVRLLPPVRDRGHVDLASGQALVLELVWDNWCDGDISAAQVRIELPGAATVETEPFQPAPSSCDPSRESTLRVFQMGLSEADKADVPDELLPRPEGDEKVKVGAKYHFAIYTHCGVNEINLEGDYWVATEQLGGGSTPRGWTPMQTGWLTIVSPNVAVFRDALGHVVTFERQPNYEATACL